VARTLDGVPARGVLETHVDLQPQSPAGGDELESAGTSSSMVALPYTVIAALLMLILGGLAWRAYKRHRDSSVVEVIAPPIGEVVEAEVVEHQPS
jgi:hypothetical protein